ncbi:nesprin-3 isoform X2 [Lissotriton helveticus]
MIHQQPQDEFENSLEGAEAWMKAIQDRLRLNDNTQGPRSALEARLRETERICEMEPEGRFKMDLVLMKAEALLQDSSEDEKHEIQTKLKDIKSMFEDTTTYMTHCHSRIEWVWLHWSEYLKARDEFTLWIHNMRLTLEPDIELQLGLKEKQWQFSHAQVLLKDVHNQSTLLDRLLEEAAALYNRIGDPSVDEEVQNQMKRDYEGIKKKAQERVGLLANIMSEHKEYQGNIDQFRTWLNDVIEKLKNCVGATTESTEARLKVFQEIANDVKSGEQRLEWLDGQSAHVITHTSPLGAEKIKAELDELRKALAKLKLMNDEETEDLMKAHQSESAYQALLEQLEADVREFRKLIESLESSLESGERVKTEEELIARWRKYSAARAALAAEEPRVEGLKSQLKELFRFSQDVQDPSNSVISAIREYQSVKSKAFKHCTETESALRQCFQNPLREFQHWKPAAEQVLDTTADMTDLPMIQNFSAQIETLIEESSRLKERLMMVQLNKDFMRCIFDDEKAESLLSEVTRAAKEREALHDSLLQRRSSFKISVSQSEDFDSLFEPLQKSLNAIRIKVAAENQPQPDVVGKEAQLQRLQILHEDLLKLGLQLEELDAFAQRSPAHKHKINQLSSDYLALKRILETMIQNSRQYVNDHRILNTNLLDLQSWIMETRQALESFQGVNGEWNFKDRESDFEGLIDGFPVKEVQLHHLENQGHRVMENSSVEGSTHVASELKQLNTYWASLLQLAATLARFHKGKQLDQIEMDAGKIVPKGKSMFPSLSKDNSDGTGKRIDTERKQDMEITSSSDDCNGSEKRMAFGGGEHGMEITSSNVDINGIKKKLTNERRQKETGLTPSVEEFERIGNNITTGSSEKGTAFISLGNNIDGTGKRITSGIQEHRIEFASSSEDEMITPRNETDAGRRTFGLTSHSVAKSKLSEKNIHERDSNPDTRLTSSTDHGITVPGKQIFAARHNYKLGFTSEAEGADNKSGSQGIRDAAGIASSSVQDITAHKKVTDERGFEWTIGQGAHGGAATELKMNSEAARGETVQELSFFNDDEMIALRHRMGTRGRKQASSSSQIDGNILSAREKMPVVDGKEAEELTPYSEGADESKRTVQFPSYPGKGMTAFSDHIKGTQKLPVPSVKDGADYSRLIKEFEEWLRMENTKLNKILTTTSTSDEDMEARRQKLLVLQSRVPEGQRLFEALRHYRPAMGITEDLQMEDLRYHWMLYKSKLKDSSSISALESLKEPVRLQKKAPGICSFLYRVCCAALPLQLLLLLLLLLAFLLPLAEENHSCTLANNFARSFSLMLRYEKPPPT